MHKRQAATLRRELEMAEAARDALLDDKEKRIASLEKAHADVQQLRRRAEAAESSQRELETALEAARAAEAAAGDAAEASQRAAAAERARLAAVEAQLGTLHAGVDGVVAETELQLDELRRENERLLSEMAAVSADNDALDEQLRAARTAHTEALAAHDSALAALKQSARAEQSDIYRQMAQEKDRAGKPHQQTRKKKLILHRLFCSKLFQIN